MNADQLIIRDVGASDLDTVLSLNQSEVPHVGSVNAAQMRWYAENATYFRVAITGGELGAYLVGFRPGTSYTSPNYLWFCEHYDDFAYVDRVAVAASARRAGIATRLYDDFAAAMPQSVTVMTCEVNVRPPNDSSMKFHRMLGFEQVGSLVSEAGNKEVALLLKHLR
jgi:predicted GNAT superfamily acetyltransferase